MAAEPTRRQDGGWYRRSPHDGDRAAGVGRRDPPHGGLAAPERVDGAVQDGPPPPGGLRPPRPPRRPNARILPAAGGPVPRRGPPAHRHAQAARVVGTDRHADDERPARPRRPPLARPDAAPGHDRGRRPDRRDVAVSVADADADRSRAQQRTALASVVAAAALVALKLVTGLLSGSLGLIAEALHSGTDLVAALLTFLALRVAGRPPDREHAYGHGKAEHLAALGQGGFLVLVSGLIGIQAVVRLVEGGEHGVDAAWWALAVVAGVIGIDA